MSKAFLVLALILAACLAVIEARNYAVIVAGSNYYYNYRHQSDIAHHYHVLINNGYKQEDIITFMYDDLANNSQNPFPSTTFNTPAPTSEGINYYAGVKIDYSGKKVTPRNFLNAIIGNSTGVGPVLNTGPEDNILFTFSDHGAPGLIAFPDEELYVKDFKAALDYMTAKKRFNKLAIYIEACESGSMCMGGVVNENENIICLTASDEKQSSWGLYCGQDEAKVNGKYIGSCLADEFAWNLADYIDQNGISGTIGDHYNYLKVAVARSPVQYFGNEKHKSWGIGEFFSQVGFTAEQNKANIAANKQVERPSASGLAINSRDNTLHYLYSQYLDSTQQLSFDERVVAGENLLQEIQQRLQVDKRFTRVAAKVLQQTQPSNSGLLGAVSATSVHTMDSNVAAINCGKCCEASFKFISRSSCKFNDYSLKYAKTVHNLCTMNGKDMTSAVISALQQECDA